MVVALLINATLIMGGSIFPKTDRHSLKGLAVTALAFVLLAFLQWNVFSIILLSGLLGVLFFYFGEEFRSEKGQADSTEILDTRTAKGSTMSLP